MVNRFRFRKWKKLLKRSWLFDEAYYLRVYEDVRRADVDAIEHFLKYGARERRNPSEGFDTTFYLDAYPDVLESGLNPLVHYLLHGRPEGRVPRENPLPDPEWPLIIPKPSGNPLVSIVIPVYNQFEYTYACLRSIHNNCHNIDYEIIIADDCSSDETVSIDRYVKNLHVVRNERNLGFLLNCNHAAQKARGEFIVFLNNDTQVRPDWLETLVELLERDETIGIAGSKLIYPDGRLQEAGGIVWSDASGWNYGRLDDPEKPEYNYLKETDYLSGASIIVRRDLWNKIGGFDERYIPAYYEDTDLAFEARKRGYRVVFQPKSVVVHFEGVSNGTDLDSGMKRYQVINHERFLKKWRDVLEREHFPNAKNLFLARDRSRNRPHMLFVDHYLPHYDQDAGSKAAFQYLKIFVESGMQVTFIGDNFWYYPDTPYLEALTQMGIEVLYGNWYANHWREWIRENGKYLDYVVLSRPHIAVKYIDIAKEETEAKIIYFGHDLHFLRERREYEIKGDPKYLESSSYWQKEELKLMEKSDVAYYFSDAEKRIVQELDDSIAVDVVPLYIFDDFKEGNYRAIERRNIMFVGGFAHAPNTDAMRWFVEEVWPRVHERIPELHFYIIGSNPPPEVVEMADENITVTGFVTDEELEAYYGRCRLVVAPLRYGAGVKGKIVDALYHGMPVVTTSIGAEGIAEAERFMEIVDDSEGFAEAVVALYKDEARLEMASEMGQRNCRTYFSQSYARQRMANVISEFKVEI